MDIEMTVTKRNGEKEIMMFDKIVKRLKNIGNEVNLHVNYTNLAIKVIDQLYDGIKTSHIDELSAQQCASLVTNHHDYSILASRILISNHHKNTIPSFSNVMKQLYDFKDIHGNQHSMISEELYKISKTYEKEIENMIDYDRDYYFNFFGFKTLERAYLMKINKNIIERPQHMWMRVSFGIHGNNLKKVKTTYDNMSNLYFTHATPTLFNAGTPHPQLSSCYLQAMESDSIDGIYNTLKDCANISKWAGGIGLHIHNIRGSGTHIRGTNGTSNGIVPMLRVFNNTARYVDQCISPDTWIYTTQGPMHIENVISGETQIFNSTGKPETIENILEHPYDGEMLSIKTTHSLDPLQITENHPIYVLANQQKTLNYKTIINRLNKNIANLEWKDAKDLTCDDMLVYPIPTYEKDITTINKDDCYFYGVLLGDGNMKNNTDSGHITLHTTEKAYILSFIKNYLDKKYIQYFTTIDENITRIRWNKTVNLPFKYSDIYDINKEKHISYRWLNLPIEKSKYIIKGLVDTDGCNKKELVFDSTSRQMIEAMRYLLLKMGILSSGYNRDKRGESHMTIRGIIENKKISYCLRIPKTKEICNLMNIEKPGQFFKFLKYNDFLFTRIKSIDKIKNYRGTLYDLQMKETHDYTIHNGIIHNGGGKRNGSFAIYLEPWHSDIEDFLQMRKNHGDEEKKARDLFYALWIPDLFMKRIKENGKWTLMCPDECPGLSDVYGDEFEKLYEKYENENRGKNTINARELWFKILDSQIETGTPYMLYKDAANKKSNQKNLGTIKSSNLCTEIIEYSDDKETAVCNLASIGLSKFVKEDKTFDYEHLHEITKIITENLNKVIDINFYPTEKTKVSNMRHRPIGIGVQGLADVFAMMNIPYESDEAREINKLIFETIYHGALEMSNELSKARKDDLIELVKTKRGWSEHKKDYIEENTWTFTDFSIDCQTYNTLNKKIKEKLLKHRPIQHELNTAKSHPNFAGSYSSIVDSPISKGLLQFDLWGVTPSDRYDWNLLKQQIKESGVRNSLLLAPMPTASTSQILGNNECFEPFTSNIYIRRTLAGEFVIVNKYLMKELLDLNIWNETVKNSIIAHNGSVQQLDISDFIKKKYKTAWEISMKHLIDMSKDRGAFICQSQSLNLWLEEPTYNNLTSMHFYAWESGLKTGLYYLRTRAKAKPQQFTIEPDKKPEVLEDTGCEMCSA
tara:strand:+ start:122 stop:3724 length:3603 start_codon:yes stop_codon:yes gene_type:complete